MKKVRYEYSGGERSLAPCALLNGITDIAPPGWSAETIADRNIAVICQIESAVSQRKHPKFSTYHTLHLVQRTHIMKKEGHHGTASGDKMPPIDVLYLPTYKPSSADAQV